MVRIVISDSEKGKAYQLEPDETEFERLVGLEIGDSFGGEIIDLPGYELEITGGSDKEGFTLPTPT